MLYSNNPKIFNERKVRSFLLPTTILSLLFFLIPLIQADIISQNAGGNNEIVIGSDQYIEGFFFGDAETGAVCGNGIIETGETCDDGNTVSGDGCSATCQTETPSSGGGGGTSVVRILLNPEEFNIDLEVNTTTERKIRVTNIGTRSVTVNVNESNLGNHIILENKSITIPAGQGVDLKVIFVALSEPGIFTGTINIDGKVVLVVLNVRTKLLLFDSNIIVLNDDYLVPRGDELRTRINLIPMGDPVRLDVGLFFTIRDYSGKVFLTKSETILIEQLTIVDRNFDTGLLPIGDYIVGVELVYPNGVAPSSAHFQIIGEGAEGRIVGKLILFLVSLILIVLISIILVLIWRRTNEKEDNRENVE
jgi:cysteine-rich repeat protein